MTYTQVWDPMNNQVNDKMIKRDEDGAFIPFDPGNRHYKEYQKWLDEGNTPNPVPEIPTPPIETVPPPSNQELAEQVSDIDQRLTDLEQQVVALTKVRR
jgi:hypothetical protein